MALVAAARAWSLALAPAARVGRQFLEAVKDSMGGHGGECILASCTSPPSFHPHSIVHGLLVREAPTKSPPESKWHRVVVPTGRVLRVTADARGVCEWGSVRRLFTCFRGCWQRGNRVGSQEWTSCPVTADNCRITEMVLAIGGRVDSGCPIQIMVERQLRQAHPDDTKRHASRTLVERLFRTGDATGDRLVSFG